MKMNKVLDIAHRYLVKYTCATMADLLSEVKAEQAVADNELIKLIKKYDISVKELKQAVDQLSRDFKEAGSACIFPDDLYSERFFGDKVLCIGIIHWADDDTPLDNTYVNPLEKVWRSCCRAHPLHAGRICICKVDWDKDGDVVVGELVKEFQDVDDCRLQFENEYGVQAPQH